MTSLRYLIGQLRGGMAHGANWGQLRYYFRWKKALRPGASSMEDRLPWLTFPAIDRLKAIATSDLKVFEYGGGGSTLFWCDRVREVVTVEHDATWFAALEAKMKDQHGARWTGHFVGPTKGHLVGDPDPADPAHYASSDPAYRDSHFKEYVQAISAYPDAYFDLVLIDGRARTSCVAECFPKLKPGGWLVLDNAERDHYTRRNMAVLAQCQVQLAGMAPVIYIPDLSETRIYRKR